MVCRVDPDELDPEAPEGVESDVEREQARRARVEAPLDDEDEEGGRGEVPDDLVEKRGVVGGVVDRGERPVDGVDLEAPGKARRLAEELLVPPVADPADRLGHEQPGCEAVGQQPDFGAGPLRDVAADETSRRDPAPDAEPAFPDRERAPPLIRHLVPARREVIEPRADDSRADAPDGAAEDEVPVTAAVDEAVTRDPDADADRREQRQAVHVDRERADVDGAARGRGYRRNERRHRGERVGEFRILPTRQDASLQNE